MAYETFTIAQRPDLEQKVLGLSSGLPEFMGHDEVVNRHWLGLYSDFPEFQVAICDAGEVVAAGNTIPVSWDGKDLPDGGLDAALKQGVQDRQKGRSPALLSALFATVAREHRGKGLSRRVVEAMSAIAAEHVFRGLIAPVRPSLKSRYPLTPMERYVKWKRDDGLVFDPWMRVHERLGAVVIKTAPRSMLITGTVAEWEEWTGMRFPESGTYVVPGALEPVVMDVEGNLGTYVEPNVWMVHRIEGANPVSQP